MSMHDVDPTMDPTEFWEGRYGTGDNIWSGKANAVLEKVASKLTPGTALDLGAGEGGDVLWLASLGWDATGLELSRTAVARAESAAEKAGLTERTHFFAQDLHQWQPEQQYDLVTASFFQSPVALERHEILKRATQAVASGGTMLITSHTAPPSGKEPNFDRSMFPQPDTDLAALNLDPELWDVATAEIWTREGTHHGHDEIMTFEDTVVIVRRK